jgi:putative FmdB family regulatory protein
VTVPISEFTCNVCGEAFEIMAALSERDEKVVCPPAPAD